MSVPQTLAQKQAGSSVRSPHRSPGALSSLAESSSAKDGIVLRLQVGRVGPRVQPRERYCPGNIPHTRPVCMAHVRNDLLDSLPLQPVRSGPIGALVPVPRGKLPFRCGPLRAQVLADHVAVSKSGFIFSFHVFSLKKQKCQAPKNVLFIAQLSL